MRSHFLIYSLSFLFGMCQNTDLAKQKHFLLCVPKENQSISLEAAFLFFFFFFLYTKFEGVLSTFLRQENEELKEDKSYTTGNTCHSKTYNNMFTDLRGHP